MKTVTQKDIKAKKPIQVYFEQETVWAINEMAAKEKIPVAEYIRNAVIKDLKISKKKRHEHKSFDLGGPLTNAEMDQIIYQL